MQFVLMLLLALALLARPFAEAASSLAYCATDNTGSSFSAVSDTYQSNGACEETCADYALGILQGKNCWCSNVAPSSSSRKSTSECSTGCPGYPDDSCGSASKGVYAYVKITGNSVTSTEGGSSSSTTTSSTSSTTSDSTTPTGSVVKETTSAGEVKTITVSAASQTGVQDSSSANAAATGSSKLSGGSIAGIVIGVIGGLALVGALIFLVFFYRKRARSASPIPSTADMTENRNSQASSFARGIFPQGHSHDLSGSSSLGRKHTFTDNRLKTDIYPNGPRDSSVSLQDNEDYSRPVLRLTNPD
ncbi:Cell wall integrity and stress response component 4 [Penicillium subrubescens]|uniref:Cell wall integrity and stress response component 4 n=1 Tax=Penicillium subrubescens TaxID=1316194 RepID=A0A1Q5TI14_9EURO|nr:Cell wall integrity and stress response component 4 [Penicillium subrubescens]